MEKIPLSKARILLTLATIAVFHSRVVADLDSDREALLEFAASVRHVRELNWNSILPVCGSWTGIKCDENGGRVVALRLPGFGLYGSVPSKTIGRLDALRVLSLRGNDLTGDLPQDVLDIASLRSVYLQHNNFSGKLPASLPPKIVVLDLSFNSFVGGIPHEAEKLTRLRVFNVSHNMLTGPIPDSLEKKFPSSSFEGNSFSVPPLPPPPTQTTSSGSTKRNNFRVIIIVAGVLFSVMFLALLVVFFLISRRKFSGSGSEVKDKIANGGRSERPEDFGSGVQDAEKNELVFFPGCLYSFNLEDLLRASAEVLGKGSFGTAYKASLDEATMVVVKRLREVCVGKREFEQHMEIIGKVSQHDNVVPPRAYYFSKDEKLVVSDYFPSGSLSAALQRNKCSTGGARLDWESRLKIAVGVAKGIAHIHSEGGAKFAHGNIKSSNVLLTENMDGCVSDVGLGPLMNNVGGTNPRRPGYRAPEVFVEARRVTHKSDVYSFGVVLLEMLTGKSAVPVVGQDDVVDLPRWARSVVREEWTAEVFDIELMRYPNIEEEMVQMLQTALSCVAKVPEMRPTMAEVVQSIEEIRQPRPSSDDDRSKDSNAETPE